MLSNLLGAFFFVILLFKFNLPADSPLLNPIELLSGAIGLVFFTLVMTLGTPILGSILIAWFVKNRAQLSAKLPNREEASRLRPAFYGKIILCITLVLLARLAMLKVSSLLPPPVAAVPNEVFKPSHKYKASLTDSRTGKPLDVALGTKHITAFWKEPGSQVRIEYEITRKPHECAIAMRAIHLSPKVKARWKTSCSFNLHPHESDEFNQRIMIDASGCLGTQVAAKSREYHLGSNDQGGLDFVLEGLQQTWVAFRNAQR